MNDKDEFQDPRVEEALNKVLDSTAFAASKQSQALLKYLVARSQQEDDGSLKERMIGVNVFGRSHDYNTGDDPIVRARVGEVRKRLARYYQSELADQHTVRFAIPTGSYRVTFSFPDANPDSEEDSSRRYELESEEPRSESPPQLQPLTTEKASPRSFALLASFNSWLILLATFAVGVTLMMGVLHHRDSRRVSVRDDFWSPLLDSSQTVVIYLGQNSAYVPTQSYMRQIRESRPFDEDEKRGTDVSLEDLNPGEKLEAGDVYADNNDLISAGNIAATVQIASLLGSLRRDADVRTGEGLSAEDLEHASAVFIGGFDNKWTMQISEGLPFRFEIIAGETDAIVEQAGQKRAWMTHLVGPIRGVADKEYAIVARLSSSVFRRPVIVAAGLRSAGTRAAGDFVANPITLSKFLEELPPDWRQKNLEAVLQVDMVKGVPGAVRPIAFSVW
jgi:hypothetical protein